MARGSGVRGRGGAAAGVERLLAIAQRRFGGGGEREATAWMIYFGVCVDLLADGLMIGAGASVSIGLGVVLALGQAPADFPEGFASIATLRRTGVPRRRRLFVAVAFLIPVLAGAVAGFWILRDASSATRWVVLAFTAGVLLTVALEEMLVEAHTRRDFPQMTQAVGDALRGDDEVLEVAAGTGVVTAAVAPRARRYVATDQTPEMLAVLSQALGDLQNLETRVADALALDFPDASFDAVVMANLLHLLPEPGRALAEARRVLRPRGRLIAPTFCHGEGALARCVSHILVTTGFPVVTRFRGDDLEDLVATARFVVIGTHWHRGLLPIRFVAARRL